MNKYHRILTKILSEGKAQENKKGRICYLLNEQICMTPADLLDIFEGHGIARKKLKDELNLFMQGERDVKKYQEAGITWSDYCGHTLVNSILPILKSYHRSLKKSMRKSAIARTMCCFWVQPV